MNIRMLLAASATAVTLSIPTSAMAAGGQSMIFVAPTEFVDGSGDPLSLCKLISTHTLFGFLPLWTSLDGYVIADNGCDTESYYDYDAAALAEDQAANMISTSVPAQASLSLSERISGMWGGFALALFVLFGIGKKYVFPTRVTPNQQQIVQAYAVIMGHAAKSDGAIDDAEIDYIRAEITRLVGGDIDKANIATMVNGIQITNQAQDLRAISTLDLAEDVREAMLTSAIKIIQADGSVAEVELTFLKKLAKVLKLSDATVDRIVANASA